MILFFFRWKLSVAGWDVELVPELRSCHNRWHSQQPVQPKRACRDKDHGALDQRHHHQLWEWPEEYGFLCSQVFNVRPISNVKVEGRRKTVMVWSWHPGVIISMSKNSVSYFLLSVVHTGEISLRCSDDVEVKLCLDRGPPLIYSFWS